MKAPAYCPVCDGEGLVYREWKRVGGEASEEVCKRCGGTGQVMADFPEEDDDA